MYTKKINVRYVDKAKKRFDKYVTNKLQNVPTDTKSDLRIERLSVVKPNKVITLANHKEHRQYSEPIKIWSNYM